MGQTQGQTQLTQSTQGRPFPVSTGSPEEYLVSLLREVVREKQKRKSWGTFTLSIHFKDGEPDTAEVNDATKVKFSKTGQ